MTEVSTLELRARIRHELRVRGGMTASNLVHRISRIDEYPITHEQIYSTLVRLEAEEVVSVAGGYRPYWTLRETEGTA